MKLTRPLKIYDKSVAECAPLLTPHKVLIVEWNNLDVADDANVHYLERYDIPDRTLGGSCRKTSSQGVE